MKKIPEPQPGLSEYIGPELKDELEKIGHKLFGTPARTRTGDYLDENQVS